MGKLSMLSSISVFNYRDMKYSLTNKLLKCLKAMDENIRTAGIYILYIYTYTHTACQRTFIIRYWNF